MENENTDGKTPLAPHPTPQKKLSDDPQLAVFLTEFKEMRKKLEEISSKKELPIEARITKVEGRLMILEELLTEETPTGKTKISKLGKKRSPFFRGR